LNHKGHEGHEGKTGTRIEPPSTPRESISRINRQDAKRNKARIGSKTNPAAKAAKNARKFDDRPA
jgi:hypothetical protein